MAFKGNKNALAYLKFEKSLSKSKLTNSTDMILKNSHKKKNKQLDQIQNIYDSILDHVKSGNNQNINKLMDKFDKKYKYLSQKPNNYGHQRAKSYANIMIDSGVQSSIMNDTIKKQSQLKLSHYLQNNCTRINRQKYIQPYRQVVSRFSKEKQHNQTQKIERFSEKNYFLNQIDKYIERLNSKSFNKEFYQNHSKYVSEQLNNDKLLKKLQSQNIKIKQLKMKYNLNKLEEAKFCQKQSILKQKIAQMQEIIEKLSKQLGDQHQEKQKMQNLLSEFQQRIKIVKPQRKTIGYRSPKKRQHYLSYDFLDQQMYKDESNSQIEGVKSNKYKQTKLLTKNHSSKKFKELSFQKKVNDWYYNTNSNELKLQSQYSDDFSHSSLQ